MRVVRFLGSEHEHALSIGRRSPSGSPMTVLSILLASTSRLTRLTCMVGVHHITVLTFAGGPPHASHGDIRVSGYLGKPYEKTMSYIGSRFDDI
jgi:hypothetical protein